jgi:hypothetical protein
VLEQHAVCRQCWQYFVNYSLLPLIFPGPNLGNEPSVKTNSIGEPPQYTEKWSWRRKHSPPLSRLC